MISSSLSPHACPTCSSRDRSALNGVISSCLDCFLNGGKLYRYEYNVKPAACGTCTLAPSDPLEDVLSRAKYLLRDGFGVYKLFKNNCETFSLYCKTGLVVSEKTGQANSVSATSGTALAFASAGLQMVGYGIYCYGRLESDIGKQGRKDVKKVPVEELVTDLTVVDALL
ncbi:unnamed protein product [Microthlaspi erraticum]|uniref:LRAT domain-containing protein n=1 Tax=Microthlaspi erraticum TaxID=1685480 RepID=A0A6D2IWL3_9BRAS|nr:unnamed protein product [Microthlaspi erraticum]